MDKLQEGIVMRKVLWLTYSLLLLGSVPAWPAPRDGLGIFTEAAARDAGYGDQSADIVMTMKDKSRKEDFRAMRLANLEIGPGEYKTTLVFDKPLDVAGTSLLTYAHAKAASDQWIYLPAFKRVKKISDANKTGSFMGSEFTFEDINSMNIQIVKFQYTLIGTEVREGAIGWTVERDPIDENSGYKRQVVWIDTLKFTVGKIEFFNREDKHVKTLTLTGYEKFLDRYWRPKEMKMENLENGKGTLLTWNRYRFKKGLKEKDFDISMLKR